MKIIGKNKVANIFKVGAIAFAVIGSIGNLILASEYYFPTLQVLVCFVVIAVTCFTEYAFGEVIQLLQDIKDNGSTGNKADSNVENNELPNI